MKQLHTTYSFTPGTAGSATVQLTGILVNLEQILLITDVTTSDTLYQFNRNGFGATAFAQASGNSTVTLERNASTGFSAGDALQIYYDDAVLSSSSSTLKASGKGSTAAGNPTSTTANANRQPLDVILYDPTGSPIDFSSNATVVEIASSASSVTLRAANNGRRTLIIQNDSNRTLFVKFGSGASSTSYTFKLSSNDSKGIGGAVTIKGSDYSGIVTGIWDSVNGNAYVTEVLA